MLFYQKLQRMSIIRHFIGLLLIFPLAALSQGTPQKIIVFNGTVELMVPDDLKPMSDKIWQTKYPGNPKPPLALSDGKGDVNLIARPIAQALDESQLYDYTTGLRQGLEKNNIHFHFLSNGTLGSKGHMMGYLKFISDAVDQKIFNYMWFAIKDGKVIQFSLNSPQSLQADWEPAAEIIARSVIIK
jgi:hypothetical protein